MYRITSKLRFAFKEVSNKVLKDRIRSQAYKINTPEFIFKPHSAAIYLSITPVSIFRKIPSEIYIEFAFYEKDIRVRMYTKFMSEPEKFTSMKVFGKNVIELCRNTEAGKHNLYAKHLLVDTALDELVTTCLGEENKTGTLGPVEVLCSRLFYTLVGDPGTQTRKSVTLLE